MQSIELLRFSLGQTIEWSRDFSNDLADMAMLFPTAHGGNHVMWIFGHLAVIEGHFLEMISGETNPIAEWQPLFGQGTEPSADPAAYPPFEEVRAKFYELRTKTLELLERTGEQGLGDPPAKPPEMIGDIVKTKGHAFELLALHQMTHFGQVDVCRRAAGRKWRF